jgi:hypothetical protein
MRRDVSEEAIMRNIATSLQGPALDWYQKAGISAATFEQFLLAFKKHFIPPGYSSVLSYKLESLYQREGQQLRDFVNELRHGHMILGSDLGSAALLRVVKLRMLPMYRAMPGAVGDCNTLEELLTYADKVEDDTAAVAETIKHRAQLAKSDVKPTIVDSSKQAKVSKGILNVAGIGVSEGAVGGDPPSEWVKEDVRRDAQNEMFRKFVQIPNHMPPETLPVGVRNNYWGHGWQLPYATPMPVYNVPYGYQNPSMTFQPNLPYLPQNPQFLMPPNVSYPPSPNVPYPPPPNVSLGIPSDNRRCFRCHQVGHVVRHCPISKNE